ncbi:MAG: histidine--tRNA ligase [Coriobacteriales bacterium]|jgi:histidyl-tRNA synthetase
MPYKAPKGTQDLLPSRARAWHAFTATANRVFSRYGYEPIETPVFELSELFTRSAGEGTDIASKEIFAVRSLGALAKMEAGQPLKADQKLALRPEGTASVVRAIAEHNLVPQGGAPAKLWYAGSMFRCERPQKGRLREFHQVGIECLGATDASADAEMIIMCMRFFEELGLKRESMTLLINSMGDENCRPAYTEAVRDYMRAHADELCDECKVRTEANPLRAFDCKNPRCHEVMDGAPRFSDYLCDDCKARFDTVKDYLTASGIDFVEDPRLVRGFDYYTGTVFEVQVTEGLGSQSAIGGGGHYDKLMGEISGRDLPGLGFAVGFERIMLALEAAGVDLDGGYDLGAYVVNFDESTRAASFKVLQQLRDAGISAVGDSQGRSVKSQFKVAGKSGARCAVVVGPDELAEGQVTLRDMKTHDEKRVALDDVVDAVRGLF